MVRKQKPNWWLVYALVPLVIGSLILEGQLSIPPVIHRIAESGIVLMGFGSMLLWVRANEGALIDEEIEKEPWTIEPDPAAKAAIDPALLPSADDCNDSEDGEHRLEASPTKGRYN
jgi:hypothetical protein